MRKKKKAEERANAGLELQQAVDEAAQLAQGNATLMQELNRARLNTSSGIGFAILSTSTTSVGGP